LDIREEILRNVQAKEVTASIIADDDGIVAGTASTRKEVENLGLCLLRIADESSQVKKGDEILRFSGSPKQIVMAEEVLMGLLAKPSGIATSAHAFVKAAGGKPQIVSGAWKKMPPSAKNMVREAVTAGGANFRIAPPPFVYLDKNYVQLLGGIKRSLELLSHLTSIPKVVQVRGTYANVISEACEAAEYGAAIVFIDTGKLEDIQPVSEGLVQRGLRNKVQLAFGGGVTLENIEELKALDIDILDIGRPIVDAPILDMRLEIVGIEN
jgi:nicotinate-nucleotide pyrophosphorylase (carboxylating)